MSKSIYRPYFYIIQHINSGKFYAGVKYARDANPDLLLKSNGYQTSSIIVKQIIIEEGIESFVIRKIRVFKTGKEALNYEYRYLRRINAAFNDKFFNRSNCSIDTLNIDQEKIKQTNITRYGVEHTLQSPEIREKIKKTCLEKFGCEFSMQSEIVKEKRKQNTLAKYGVSNSFQVPEFQEKQKQTLLKKYDVDNLSKVQEFQDKKRQSFHNLRNRPIILELKKYKDMFNLKFGSGWILKKQGFLDNLLVELKSIYDLEHPIPILNSKEKWRRTFNIMNNRPVVLEIRKYQNELDLKLGHSWYMKSQDILDTILTDIKLTYGDFL